jgi:hypothetical protein
LRVWLDIRYLCQCALKLGPISTLGALAQVLFRHQGRDFLGQRQRSQLVDGNTFLSCQIS